MKKPQPPKTLAGCSLLLNLFDLYKLYNRIKKNEGYRNTSYNDLFGNKTIGYGHLINKSEKYLLKGSQSKKYLTYLFIKDLNIAIRDFKKNYNTNKISGDVQEVIIEMIFQLGIKNMLGFKKFNKYINKNQLFMAALEMIDSNWYKQTPRRVDKLMAVMVYNHNE